MNKQEWEALCDRCGLCCLIKREDADTGTVYYTSVICKYYDLSNSCCSCYESRMSVAKNTMCIELNESNIVNYNWLPSSCAYVQYMKNGLPIHKKGKYVVENIGNRLIVEENEMDYQEHILHKIT